MTTPNPTILVIDDERYLAQGAVCQLKQNLEQTIEPDCQILIVSYAGPILELCQSQPIQGILLESHCPDSRGFELLEQLQAQLAAQCPPIIVIDSNDATLAKRAIKAGASDYLVRGEITAQALHQALQAGHSTSAKPDQHDRENFLEISSDLEAILGKDGYFHWVCPNFEPLLGWTSTEMTCRPWAEFVHPDDVDASVLESNRVFAGHETVAYENRYRCKDGGYRWLLWRARLDRSRQLLHCTAIDITEHKRTKAFLQASEEKYLTLFNSIDEGFCVFQLIYDDNGRAVDWIYLEANSAFEQQTRWPHPVGKHILELQPDLEESWFATFEQLVKTGEPIRFVRESAALHRWYDVYAFPVGAADQPRVALLFEDITQQKQVEQKQIQAARLDAFRVALSDALRPLADPIEVQSVAGGRLAAELNANRVYYYEFDDAEGRGSVHQAYVQEGLSDLVGVYGFEEFPSIYQLLRPGHPLILDDVANSAQLTESERDRLNSLCFGALVAIPLVKHDRLVAIFAVCSASPHHWDPLEIKLIRETADFTWAAVERARAEGELRASEAKYRKLFTSIDEGYCLIEVIFDDNDQPIDLLYLDANPSAIRILGQDFTGRRISDINPNYEASWFDMFGTVVRTGEGQRLERYAEPDQKWYDFYVFKVGEADSRRIAVIFQDITARKRREANAAFLADLTQDFSLLSGTDEIMQAVGARMGAYLNITSCLFAEIDEAQNQAVVTYNWHTASTPDLKGVYRLSDFVTEEFQQIARAGKTIVIRDTQADPRTDTTGYAARQIHAYVTVPFHRDGVWKYLFSVNDAVARNWSDDDIELIREVTSRVFPRIERVQAEAKVAADLEATQYLHNLGTQLITETDSQKLYEQVVDTAMAIARADAGSFQCLHPQTDELQLLVTRNFSAAMVKHFDRIMASSQTSCGQALAQGKRAFVDFDAPPQDSNGSLQLHLDHGLLSAQSTPLISRSGKLLGMFSTHWRKRHRPSNRELRFLDLLARQATDLIEQRQAYAERQHLLEREQAARAEAERANRIKDEFLAILSHELRSPLNPILGWSNLLQQKQLSPEKTQQALATIERNAKLQTQLIDDLLDVAKILRGKLQITDTPIDLAIVIAAAVDVVSTAAEAKGISIHTRLAADCLVKGDDARLQQIVWNLLSNAIKFNAAGGRVEVRLEVVGGEQASPSSPPYAQITVTDTGKGISSDFLPRLFEAFLQEDVSITRRYGGLGLGLSIVKYLVEAHGGTISASSPGAGLGATFTVRLPLLQQAANPSDSSALSSSAPDLAGVKVLAVDDREDARELLAIVLTEYGAETEVVASGQEVLDILPDFQPQVLVCDIGMPDMDGYALLQRIRCLPPEQGGNVPAIAVTAFAKADDVQRALANGYQKHVAKPIEPETLAMTVAELVAQNNYLFCF